MLLLLHLCICFSFSLAWDAWGCATVTAGDQHQCCSFFKPRPVPVSSRTLAIPLGSVQIPRSGHDVSLAGPATIAVLLLWRSENSCEEYLRFVMLLILLLLLLLLPVFFSVRGSLATLPMGHLRPYPLKTTNRGHLRPYLFLLRLPHKTTPGHLRPYPPLLGKNPAGSLATLPTQI